MSHAVPETSNFDFVAYKRNVKEVMTDWVESNAA
jgi:hypothetical protein